MNFSAEQRAFWIALPITSFVSSCSFAFFPMIISPSDFSTVSIGEIAKVVGAYSLFMIPFVAAAGLVFGLPVALALRRLHFARLPVWLAAGAAAGAMFCMLLFGALAFERASTVFAWAASIGVLPGATAAFIWWHVAERRSREGALDV